jgi:ATP-binding cassette subfamily B protein
MWKLKFDKAVSKADTTVGGAYSDAITNMSVVKTFALEQTEQAQIDRASDDVYRKKQTGLDIDVLLFFSTGFDEFWDRVISTRFDDLKMAGG